MAERLPRVRAGEVLRALRRDGWQHVGQEGSHVHLRHPRKPGKVTVPIHSTVLPPGTLRSILRQAELTTDKLRSLL